MSFRRTLARFNRRVANPVTRLLAGRVGAFALLSHRGRISGREYSTPAWAFRTADGLVIGVIYGEDSDWVRNVLATGGARIKRRGVTREYEHAAMIDRDEGLPLVPWIVRVVFRLLRVRHLLVVAEVAGVKLQAA